MPLGVSKMELGDDDAQPTAAAEPQKGAKRRTRLEEMDGVRVARCQAVFESLDRNATKEGDELPASVTGLLLVNPNSLLSGQVDHHDHWRSQQLDWQSADKPAGIPHAEHSVVELATELSFGRQCGYRVHRFKTHPDFGNELNRGLLDLSPDVLGAGVLASNVGGYHSGRDLFESPTTATRAAPFRAFLDACVAAAEEADQSFRGPDGAAPTTAQREPAEAWVNISKRSSLNLLHDHSDATWSGVYYVADGRGAREGFLGGQLLLRISPPGGTNTRMSYANGLEQRHLPRMVLTGVAPPEKGPAEHAFAEIAPVPGTLLLFPGWLPHAVAPHLGTGERVSVSFNIFLRDEN